ncbi:MAG: DUF3179 domain-containing (seleno)protein [bacterium]|nr:DUF3179 domain-containing protein [Gammaproteobacteria bacterium]HIL97703.1 DUF3179 domain-containing protein [Pseudomonadales bacterium]
MNEHLIPQGLYLILMSGATVVSFRYFRDLGDITQAFLTVTRENMVFAIRNETTIIAGSAIAVGMAVALDYFAGAGWGSSTLLLVILNVFFLGFPPFWLRCGLRNQQSTATFYSIEEAKNYVRPTDSVIVLENNGKARAHPDYHIKRPHLAGTPEGLGGENIIMTYCTLTNLGLGYKPEIDGKSQDLTVIAQHGNNLIMRDTEKGEPIQQMYGARECDGPTSKHAMQQWPTFRMSFRGFQKAYPDGTVFLNKITPFRKNPFVFLFDHLIEVVFLWATVPHRTNNSLMFETMDVEDDRLMMKELVWGFNVGEDSVAYTEDYVREQGGLINTQVGGRNIVVAWDDQRESLGIYYNDTGAPISNINFWGETGTSKIERVETVKAGSYWCVWVNYFPKTDINREAQIALAKAS